MPRAVQGCAMFGACRDIALSGGLRPHHPHAETEVFCGCRAQGGGGGDKGFR